MNLKILLAEDHKINRMMAVRQLETLGYEVVAVEDGAQALQQGSAMHFDAFLLDLQMPIVDGFEAAKGLRAQGISVPIVAVTGTLSEADQQRAVSCGFNAFVIKPLEVEALRAALPKG
jgi:CheY-like chemotaxis protein